MLWLKKRSLISCLVVALVLWIVSTYYFVALRLPQSKKMPNAIDSVERIRHGIAELERQIADQKAEYNRLLPILEEHMKPPPPGVPAPAEQQHNGAATKNENSKQDWLKKRDPIAVLVMSCNRPAAVKNHIDQLLKLRPSAEEFPIVVSQDCGHEDTRKAILGYGDKLTYIQQPDQSDIVLPTKQKKFVGYYKIARHYRWALNQTFFQLNYKSVIVTEDDLDIAVDFFEYFRATYTLLLLDPSLWCVSAWNDNGKVGFIEQKPELLYRTDFFPGLGWMLRREVYEVFHQTWPETFWDDWMRRAEQRKDRGCIRPEISRTAMSKHGKVGISRGLYFEKHLKFIQLNNVVVPFTQMDLSYLLKDNYDQPFVKKVYSADQISLAELQNGKYDDGRTFAPGHELRVTYDSPDQFKEYAKQLKLMDDKKAGVPRTAYRGVVPFMYNSVRVYLAPPATWTGYDANDWK